jgi:hypothetical protein
MEVPLAPIPISRKEAAVVPLLETASDVLTINRKMSAIRNEFLDSFISTSYLITANLLT